MTPNVTQDLPTTVLIDSFRSGFLARRAGQGRGRCPFLEENQQILRNTWIDGWKTARKYKTHKVTDLRFPDEA